MVRKEAQSTASDWPDLPLADWADTCATLHLWTQVVGKIRLAHAPMVNHWWQVPLYVTCRGLTTSPIPYGAGVFRSTSISSTTPDDPDEQRRNAKPSRSVREPLRISTPRSWAGCAVSGWKPGSGPCRSRYEDAIPFDRDSARFLRPGICQPFLAHPAAGGSGFHPVPLAIPRQGKSGAFLLGQLRPGGHALLRAPGAPAEEHSPNVAPGSCRKPIPTR